MTNLWKNLRETMWIGCGVGAENLVENSRYTFFYAFCCEKLVSLAEKFSLFVNNKGVFSGKWKQRGTVGVSTVSTVST